MTNEELIRYYSDLLILQYVGKQKAYTTISTLVEPVIMDQLPLEVQNAFEIGTATGVQLDVLGKYAGVTRSGVGLQGQPITLSDSDFTQLIKIAIIRNMAGSSLATIQDLLHTYFRNTIFVYDYANMRMSYAMSAVAGTQNLAELFVTEGLLPKPMGVELGALVYLQSLSTFGLIDVRNVPAAWSSGTTYDTGNQVFENAIVYASVVDGNLNNAVTDTLYWRVVTYPLNDAASYQTSWYWLDVRDL